MSHARPIYKTWLFKAICWTWCDWYCCVQCSLKSLCMKKKKDSIWIKLTAQYVFSVLHVFVWNEVSQM